MNRPSLSVLQPRKTPQQARSAATVEAIRTATIQVLLADGVARLTTTRVAERAGVSVGTMYQYFPHKQALLFAVLKQHLGVIERAMTLAAERLEGQPLPAVAHGFAAAWLDAKTADIAAARALYGVAAEFDVSELIDAGANRIRRTIERVLAAAPDARVDDVPAVAFMLIALLGGSVRTVLEQSESAADLARLRTELPRACAAYLIAAGRPNNDCSPPLTPP